MKLKYGNITCDVKKSNGINATWLWQGDEGFFYQYDTIYQIELENHFNNNEMSFDLDIEGIMYRIDLTSTLFFY